MKTGSLALTDILDNMNSGMELVDTPDGLALTEERLIPVATRYVKVAIAQGLIQKLPDGSYALTTEGKKKVN